MTKEDKMLVHRAIDSEGFHYALTGYSDFPEVRDPEFHKLRKAAVTAMDKFEQYIRIDDKD